MSGDVFCCHNWEMRLNLGVGARAAANTLQCTGPTAALLASRGSVLRPRSLLGDSVAPADG